LTGQTQKRRLAEKLRLESGAAQRKCFACTYLSRDLLEMDALACKVDKSFFMNLFQKISWHEVQEFRIQFSAPNIAKSPRFSGGLVKR
jgi:hypothetical protein